MSTPLYKNLKMSGTSFYAFPSAAEKISASYQNQNNKMYFSNYALLNFPSQNLNPGSSTHSNPIYWDFLNSTGQGYGFQQSIDATPPTSFSEQIIESLRNYVANYEETMRISKLNTTEYYYNNNALNTPSEKIFYKWCKQLNLIDFEPGNNGDQYIGGLSEFQSSNINDVSYFNEILWTERVVNNYDIYDMYQWVSSPYSGKLTIVFQTTTNYKIGDIVEINNETNGLATFLNGSRGKILHIIPPTALLGQKIIINIPGGGLTTNPNSYTGNTTLIYNKLVQYIGEVNGVNNVQESNMCYTEVYLQIAGYNGSTPDILFRTMTDINYAPNLIFPILPSQYQPEIIGAEVYTSPIVSSPQNYPGSYFAQFDTTDYTYITSAGDSLRRSGDYFGVTGDINTPIVDSTYLDGITIDFNPSHYSKMNIYGREVTNFEQFNALMINNLPPSNFEFNAILWYYTYIDINGNAAQDLYGISFLDNPDNNPIESEVGLRFPSVQKLVATDNQGGTSYDFSLDLNFYIINDNTQDTFNPNVINSLYSFNLFNGAMRRLASLNDSFNNIITENVLIKTRLSDITQLLYTQNDINTINQQITNLNDLLLLYQSNQLIPSNTIDVQTILVGKVPMIELTSIDARYIQITNILTSNMYNISGAIPYNYTLPTNKDSLINIANNDQTKLTLPNGGTLAIVINRDLDYRQTLDIIVEGNDIGSENKQLDIYINYSANSNTPVITKLLPITDLPIYYNKSTKRTNSAKNWNKFNFDIDMSSPIRLNIGSILEIPINSNYNLVSNSFNIGDVLTLNNFNIGTSSLINFSGQYIINSVGSTNSYIYLDISNNINLVSYGASNSLPLLFNDPSTYLLSNNPYLGLNKGFKYSITRVDETNSSTIEDRYLISKEVL